MAISSSSLPRNSPDIDDVSTSSDSAHLTWCQISSTIRKQERTILPGVFLCMSALILNCSYFYSDLFRHQKHEVLNETHEKHKITIALMWYVGACFGCIVCGFNRYTWPARKTNYSVGALQIVGIAIICLRGIGESGGPGETFTLCMGRFLIGCSFGFTYITIITQIGDNVWKRNRGYVATVIPFAMNIATLTALLFSQHIWPTLSIHPIMFPICVLFFTLLGIGGTALLTYEPITEYLRLDQTIEAERVLKELCDGAIDLTKVRSEIIEKTQMMAEDYANIDSQCFPLTIFSDGNWRPIVGMFLFRILHVLTSNLYFIALSAASIYSERIFSIQLVVITIHFIILFVSKYSMDAIGRRTLLAISGIGCGLCFITFTADVLNTMEVRNETLAIMTILIHVFLSLGIEPLQHVYATEAFPMSKRNASLAIITGFEYAFNGFIVYWWLTGESSMLNFLIGCTPILLIFMTFVLYIILPETKSKSIRKCRSEFNSYYNEPILPIVRTQAARIGSGAQASSVQRPRRNLPSSYTTSRSTAYRSVSPQTVTYTSAYDPIFYDHGGHEHTPNHNHDHSGHHQSNHHHSDPTDTLDDAINQISEAIANQSMTAVLTHTNSQPDYHHFSHDTHSYSHDSHAHDSHNYDTHTTSHDTHDSHDYDHSTHTDSHDYGSHDTHTDSHDCSYDD